MNTYIKPKEEHSDNGMNFVYVMYKGVQISIVRHSYVTVAFEEVGICWKNGDVDFIGKHDGDLNTLMRLLRKAKKQIDIAEGIKDFVDDHYEHFSCYPMDVEIENTVYSYEKYWAILDKGTEHGINKYTY